MTAALALVGPLLAAAAKKSSGGSPVLLIFVVIAAGFYFLIYRPQQRKAKAAREQTKTFDVGDEVLTAGGIVGHVIDIDGDRVTLETSVGASFVVLRQYVLRKLEEPEPVPSPTRTRTTRSTTTSRRPRGRATSDEDDAEDGPAPAELARPKTIPPDTAEANPTRSTTRMAPTDPRSPERP